MIVIKLMSGENLADSDVGKGYRMIVVGDGGSFNFGHDLKGNPIVDVTTHPYGQPDTATYFLEGNAYVLSDSGKTIGSFWGRRKQVKVTVDQNDPEPERTVDMVKEIFKDAAKHPSGRHEPKISFKMTEDGTRLLKLGGGKVTNTPNLASIEFMQDKDTRAIYVKLDGESITTFTEQPIKFSQGGVDNPSSPNKNARQIPVA